MNTIFVFWTAFAIIGFICWLTTSRRFVWRILRIVFVLLLLITVWNIIQLQIFSNQLSQLNKYSFQDWFELLILPFGISLVFWTLDKIVAAKRDKTNGTQDGNLVVTELKSIKNNHQVKTLNEFHQYIEDTLKINNYQDHTKLPNIDKVAIRSRTNLALTGLDPQHKIQIFRILKEFNLITRRQIKTHLGEDMLISDPVIDLSQMELNSIDVRDFNGSDIILTHAQMKNSNFSKVGFYDADLQRTEFTGSTFRNVNFSGAYLMFCKFINAKLTEVDFTPKEENSDFDSFLSSVRFDNAKLQEVNFKSCYLQGIFFPKAEMNQVDFIRTDLHDCDLSGAKLRGVSFRGAKIRNVNFENALFQDLDLQDVTYDKETKWPKRFKPDKYGAKLAT